MATERQRIHNLRVTLSTVRTLGESGGVKLKTLNAIARAAKLSLERDTAQAELEDGKTYAIKKLQYALIDPQGVPVALHTSLDQVVGYYASTRRPADIILDETSRQRIFAALLRNKYSIRKCYAWVRIASEAITELPPAKGNR